MVSSTRPPVSVCSTGRLPPPSSGGRSFSRGVCSSAVVTRRMRLCTVCFRARRFPPPGLATAFNALFRQRARVPLFRHRSASRQAGLRNIDPPCPSARPSPAGVGSRLTLNRLALFRNPWSFGGVSRPLCRYLYPAFAFPAPPAGLAARSPGAGMLPYQSACESTSSAPGLCPVIIHAGPLD